MTENDPRSDETAMPVDSEEFIRGFPPVGKLHALNHKCRNQAIALKTPVWPFLVQ